MMLNASPCMKGLIAAPRRDLWQSGGILQYVSDVLDHSLFGSETLALPKSVEELLTSAGHLSGPSLLLKGDQTNSCSLTGLQK